MVRYPEASASTDEDRRSFGVPQDDKPPSRGWPPRIAIIVILILAGVLRFHDITRHSLWLDELFTLESSAGHGLEHHRFDSSGVHTQPIDVITLDHAKPLLAVATGLARDDNHPPLYFLLLRIWRHVFGSDDAAIRAFSAMCSIACVAVLYDIIRRLHGVGPALWAALLMAVAGPQIQFAQEARAYSLLLLFALIACDALVRIEQSGARPLRCLILGACAIGMMLTHYFAIGPAAAIGLYVLIRLRGRTRVMTLLLLIAAAAAYLLIWGAGLWMQRNNFATNNWWIIEKADGHFAKTFMRFAITPFRFLTEPLRRAEPVAAIGAALFVVPILMLRRRPQLLLWILLLTIPIGMALTTDLLRQSRQLEFLRYAIAASPAVYALIATIMQSKRRWLNHVLPAAALLTCLLNLPLAYSETLTPKPDWRPAAALMDRLMQPDDVIIFFGHSDFDAGAVGSRYLALARYVKRMPRAAIFLGAKPDDATQQLLRRARGVWTVSLQDEPIPPDSLPGFALQEREATFGLPVVARWTLSGG